jgi:hypothetical protein
MQDGYELNDVELEDMPSDRLTVEDLQELYEEQMRRLPELWLNRETELFLHLLTQAARF